MCVCMTRGTVRPLLRAGVGGWPGVRRIEVLDSQARPGEPQTGGPIEVITLPDTQEDWPPLSASEGGTLAIISFAVIDV